MRPWDLQVPWTHSPRHTAIMICRILLLLTTASLSFAQSRERGHFSLQGVPATCMAIDPKPKSVLIAFSDGGICVFPADQRIVNVFTYPIHKKAITGACFMPDGKAFVTCSTDGMLRIWDTAAAIKRHKKRNRPMATRSRRRRRPCTL